MGIGELGGKVVNTVCMEKVGNPLKYTHTTYSLQISHQETQHLVQLTAAAFDKVQLQRIYDQFDDDKFSNKTLETYKMYFPQMLVTLKLFLSKLKFLSPPSFTNKF